MADTVHIVARYHPEGDTRQGLTVQNFAAAHRQHTPTGVTATGVPVTGVAETGAAVIGVAIGRVAVTGAAAADSALSAEVIRTTRIGIHIGAGALLTCTRTTASIRMRIILPVSTILTVA